MATVVKASDQITIIDLTDGTSVDLTHNAIALNGGNDGLSSQLEQTIYVSARQGNNYVQPSITAGASIVCSPNTVTAVVGNYDFSKNRLPITITFPEGLNVNGSITIPISVPSGSSEPLEYTKVVEFAVALKGDTPEITASKTGTVTTILADGTEIATINDGTNGTSGLNQATLYLYQRATSTPAKPEQTTYNFSTKELTPASALGLWKKDLAECTGTNPLYVTAAVASSVELTDTIPSAEWSTPTILSQNTNQATVFLYKRAESVTKPTSQSTYTFSTGVLSPLPNDWVRNIPDADSNGNPCWVTSNVAISQTDSYVFSGTSWSTPVRLVNDGKDGKDGADAITMVITSSAGTIFKNASISTTLTAHVYKAGVELTSSQISDLGTIKWYKNGSSTAESTTGPTYSISAGNVTNKATFEARLESTTA